MKLVAFYSSCSGTGKTTTAEKVTKLFPAFHPVSFATEVRADVWNLLANIGINPKFYYSNKDEPIPGINKSFRQLLIDYGTGFCREKIHTDYWVKRLQARLDIDKAFVIDDLRFPNEYAWLRKNNALIIRLTTGRELIKHGADGLLDSFSFDSVINTDKGRQEFDRELTEAIYQYLKD